MNDADRRNRHDLFDAWAGGYDASVQDRRDFPFLGYEDVLAAIVGRAAAAPGDSVLDVGIGTGNLAARFVSRGRTIWGMDFSRAMLDRAGQRLPGVHLVEADLGAAELTLDPAIRVDRIVSAYVLHEFPLDAKVHLLRRLTDRHLAPGGCIVIGDIAFPTAELREAAAAEWSDRWDHAEHYWSADESLPALAAAGLTATYEQVSACAGVFTIHPAVPSSP